MTGGGASGPRSGSACTHTLPSGWWSTLVGSGMVFAIDDRRRHLGSEVGRGLGAGKPQSIGSELGGARGTLLGRGQELAGPAETNSRCWRGKSPFFTNPFNDLTTKLHHRATPALHWHGGLGSSKSAIAVPKTVGRSTISQETVVAGAVEIIRCPQQLAVQHNASNSIGRMIAMSTVAMF